MNAVLAKNVKTIRAIKRWTQQHLADTAGILLRTVQRVEKGDGASLDTLGALANACDVSIDVLQTKKPHAAPKARVSLVVYGGPLSESHWIGCGVVEVPKRDSRLIAIRSLIS